MERIQPTVHASMGAFFSSQILHAPAEAFSNPAPLFSSTSRPVCPPTLSDLAYSRTLSAMLHCATPLATARKAATPITVFMTTKQRSGLEPGLLARGAGKLGLVGGRNGLGKSEGSQSVLGRLVRNAQKMTRGTVMRMASRRTWFAKISTRDWYCCGACQLFLF